MARRKSYRAELAALMGPPADTQARRIIAKFGGVPVLARLLGYSLSQVYRWTYGRDARSSGTGGVIPPRALGRIIELAPTVGVTLTSEDLDPRTTP